MKNKGFILSLIMLSFFCMRLSALELRLRLHSTICHSFNECSDGQTWGYIYHYAPGYFAVVDSMVQSVQYGYNEITYTTFTCQTSVSWPSPGHHRFDYSYYNPNGTLASIEGYETDTWGRKVYEYKGTNNITRYYPDESGWKADSLEYSRLTGSNVYYTRIVYEYDTQGRRWKGYKYSRIGTNPWAYQGFYQNSFDGTLPFPIDTEQWGSADYHPLYCLALMLDEVERVSLLEFYPVSAEPNSWVIGYNTSGGNFSYCWSQGDEYSASYEFLGFYPSGKKRHYHRSSGDMWNWSGSDTYYNWEEHPLPDQDDLSIPVPVTLYPNYPNPFNPSTTIAFNLSQASIASLSIYNAKGQLVKKLVSNTALSAGGHSYNWDGKDESGRSVATGMYLCRLQTGGKGISRKMMLIK